MGLLVPYLIASFNYLWEKLWPILNPDQALSWRTFLFLCLFSWVMALPTSEGPWLLANLVGSTEIDGSSALFFQMSFARCLLFTTGWICLCIAVAWLLVRSTIVVPFFDVVIYPAAWVVGLLTVTYFLIMGTGDVRTAAIVGWPLISAGYTLLPKVLTSTGEFKTPNTKVRQQFTMVFLASAAVSCWFQFQVLVQQWVSDYPVLLLGPLNKSAFVVPVGDRPPVLEIARNTLDQTLQLRSINEARDWIRSADQFSNAVNDRFQAKLVAAKSQLLEDLWRDVKGTSEDDTAPSTIPDLAIEPEQWRMVVAADPTDGQGLGIQMELRSRPIRDNVALNREVSMTFPCIVEPYTPPQTRVSRPLDETPEGLGRPSRPTSENVEDYIQTTVLCFDQPEVRVNRVVGG